MRRLLFVCALIPLALGGCVSNISRLDVTQTPAGPNVDSIIRQVRCELAVLVDDNYVHADDIELGDFIAVIQLNLTVNDDGSLAPSFTYTNGIFSFNAGARLEASREQNFTEHLVYDLKELKATIADEKKKQAENPKAGFGYACPKIQDTNLAGDLGIVPSVNMALSSKDLNLKSKLSGTDGAFGGYISFVVTNNLNAVGPTYTLTHFKGPGSLAGLSEVNTDKLVFAFASRTSANDILGTPAQVAKTTHGIKHPSERNVSLAFSSARAERLAETIVQNQISNSLSGIRSNLQ